MKFHSGIFPPGGFKFVDADGIEFDGESIGQVAGKLARYREANGKPPGRPVAEVNEFMCRKHPELCTDRDVEGFDASVLLKSISTNARELQNLRYLGKPAAKVSGKEADDRAAQCKACNHNVNYRIFCSPCQTGVAAQLSDALAPRAPHPDLAGRACALAGDDLSGAVWLCEPPKVDHDCWRKS